MTNALPSVNIATAFDVQERWIDGVPVLAATGDIDLLTAPALSGAIATALASEPTALIIDPTEVNFLASAGMTVLVNTRKELGETTQLAVVAAGPTTSRPMKMVGLDTVVAFCPSLNEAALACSR